MMLKVKLVVLAAVAAASCFAAFSQAAAQSNYVAIRLPSTGSETMTLRGVGDGQQVADLTTPGVSGDECPVTLKGGVL